MPVWISCTAFSSNYFLMQTVFTYIDMWRLRVYNVMCPSKTHSTIQLKIIFVTVRATCFGLKNLISRLVDKNVSWKMCKLYLSCERKWCLLSFRVFVMSDFYQLWNICHGNPFSSCPAGQVRRRSEAYILQFIWCARRMVKVPSTVLACPPVPDDTAAVGRWPLLSDSDQDNRQGEQLACDHLQLTTATPVRSVETRHKDNDA